MSHDAVGPMGPNPLANGISAPKPMKYLGGLLITQTEEVPDGNGSTKRVTTIQRSLRK